jgi:hypothetical protein
VTAATDREIIAARAARHDEEFEHLLTTALAVMQADPVAGIVRALFGAADAFSAEAADLEARKKKGYVSVCREWRDAAMKLRGLATQVENYGARNPGRSWWTLESDRAALDAIVAGLPNGSLQVDGILVPPVGPSEPAASGHYAPGLPDGYGLPADTLAGYLAGTTDVDPIAAPPTVLAVNGVPVSQPIPPDTIAPGDTITIIPPEANPFRAPLSIPDPDPWAAFTPPASPSTPVVPEAVVNPFVAPKAPGRMVVRPSFRDVVELVGQLGSNPGSSPSQIKTVRRCTMQHALGRLSRHGLIGPERPGWGAVGGTALHLAIAAYENWFETHTEPAPATSEIDEIWSTAFATTVELERASAGPYQDLGQWHASNRGKEGYDWWRVEGRVMLQRYADTHAQGWADKLSLVAQEWEYRMPITDTIESHGFVDQVWSDAPDADTEGNLIVDDLKSGSRPEKDVTQLGEYAWALVRVKGIDPARISEVAYWNARTGQRTVYSDIFDRVTWDDLVYYHVATANAKANPTPTANVTDLCGGCSVKDLCPAQRS